MALALIPAVTEIGAAFPVGVALGLAVVAPPGPISLAVVSVAAHPDRRRGVAAAFGVVGADLVCTLLAVAVASRIGTLNPTLLHGVQLLLGTLLVVAAVHGLRRPGATAQAVAEIDRPGRTLALVSIANPVALAGWLALAVALQNRFSGAGLAAATLGLVTASIGWHLALVTFARRAFADLNDSGRIRLARVSASVLLVFGALLVSHGIA